MSRQGGRDQYTARVNGRTVLARELQDPKYEDDLARAGLLVKDLKVIQEKGERAEEHDKRQREELAAQRQAMKGRVEAIDQVADEEEHLRSRLPAVSRDLAADPKTATLADWLDVVSFERFRIRESVLPTPAEGEPSAPATPATPMPASVRSRVSRTDRLSRAEATSQFCRSLLDPEREPVVRCLAERGFDRERLTALATAAADLVGQLGGSARMTAPEATRLEAEAVAAQKQSWDACRRMIRHVVAEHPELESRWAAC